MLVRRPCVRRVAGGRVPLRRCRATREDILAASHRRSSRCYRVRDRPYLPAAYGAGGFRLIIIPRVYATAKQFGRAARTHVVYGTVGHVRAPLGVPPDTRPDLRKEISLLSIVLLSTYKSQFDS